MDASIGAVLAEVRAHASVASNTLALWTHAESTGPLACGKSTAREGGVRVPAVAWWPGRVLPAAQQPAPLSTLDFFPTILALAGVAPPANVTLDGRDVRALLLSEEAGGSVADGTPQLSSPAPADRATASVRSNAAASSVSVPDVQAKDVHTVHHGAAPTADSITMRETETNKATSSHHGAGSVPETETTAVPTSQQTHSISVSATETVNVANAQRAVASRPLLPMPPPLRLFWYGGTQRMAARVGPYKAHFALQSWGESWLRFPECVPENLTALATPRLYDLRLDPSERFPLAATDPGYAAALAAVEAAVAAEEQALAGAIASPQLDRPADPSSVLCCGSAAPVPPYDHVPLQSAASSASTRSSDCISV